MFAEWPLRITTFVITLLTGLIIACAGKFIWKFTHFATGFGLLLTIFWILIYPAHVRQGYRVNWMLWISYIATIFLSAAFGFFL